VPRPERALDPDSGPAAQFAAGLRELRRQAGNPGYRELSERAGYSATTLADAAGGRRLPSLPVTLAFVSACAGDRARWERHWHEAVAGHRTGDGEPVPYRGLAPFDVGDSAVFFGRRTLVARLAELVADHPFLAVFGASGNGKSSLLHAGLVPALAPDGWSATLLTPGADPLSALRQALEEPAARRLVVVDQFEELFTLCSRPKLRAAFVEELLRLGDTGLAHVVVAVRADFYARCGELPELAEAMTAASVPIGTPGDEELREVVTGPAAVAGLTVERALIAQILADAAGQPGALPLVSHALLETCRQRRGDILTLAGYQAAGGVTGAVANTAEAVYRRIDEAHQDSVRQVLLRLVVLGEGTDDTRRRVRRDELDLPGAAEVLDELARARLIVRGGAGGIDGDSDTVEIAHEALIRSWPRLHGWLNEDREALRTRRQVTEATHAWLALQRGARLAMAREYSGRAELTPPERDFLDAGLAAQEAERQAELAVRERERRRTRQLRRLVGALVAMLVVTLGSGAFAVAGWRRAVTENRQMQSRDLAAEALRLCATDVPLAIRRAVAGYTAAPTTEAIGALLSLAGRRAYAGRLVQVAPVKAVAFAPDGATLAAAGQDGTVSLWDVAARRRLAQWEVSKGAIRAVAFTPDGHRLAAAGLDGRVHVWDVAGRVPVWDLATAAESVEAVAFSPDGRILAASGSDHRVLLWDLPSGRSAGALPAGGKASDLAFFPDSGRLATTGDDGRVTVWDVRTRTVVATYDTGTPTVHAVAVSPDGNWLAAGGDSRDISLWQVEGERRTAVLHGQNGAIRSLSFTPDSTRLVSAAADQQAMVWEVARGQKLTSLSGHTSSLNAVTVSPDGHTVAAAGDDRWTLIWDLAGPPGLGNTAPVNGLAVDAAGTTYSSAADGSVLAWREAANTGDPGTGSSIRSLVAGGVPATGIAIRSDGRLIAEGRTNDTITLLDPADGRTVATLTGHVDQVRAVAFAPTGTLLASGGADRTVRLWRDGRAVTVLVAPRRVNTIAFSPDGRMLASGGQAGSIVLWDPVTGTRSGSLPAASADILDLAISPDGRWLAAAAGTGDILVYNLTTGGGPTVLHGHSGPAQAVAFSPDGQLLASGGLDQTVRLWSVPSGSARRAASVWPQRAVLTGHRNGVQRLAWAPDGRLISGGVDQTLITWTTTPATAVTQLCATLRTSFPDEPHSECDKP
jgi:WD40 repeat protein